jgi:hypothetical protein
LTVFVQNNNTEFSLNHYEKLKTVNCGRAQVLVRADVSARLQHVDKPLHFFRQIMEIVVLSLAGTAAGGSGNFV